MPNVQKVRRPIKYLFWICYTFSVHWSVCLVKLKQIYWFSYWTTLHVVHSVRTPYPKHWKCLLKNNDWIVFLTLKQIVLYEFHSKMWISFCLVVFVGWLFLNDVLLLLHFSSKKTKNERQTKNVWLQCDFEMIGQCLTTEFQLHQVLCVCMCEKPEAIKNQDYIFIRGSGQLECKTNPEWNYYWIKVSIILCQWKYIISNLW